jgi:predicted transcriptional regulator
MDVLYAKGAATAAEIRDALTDAPGYSAVRALLRILEDKGHVRHEQQGPRYVYFPQVSKERARRSALKRLVSTFFGGSAAQAAAALIDSEALSRDEVARLTEMLERARTGERR